MEAYKTIMQDPRVLHLEFLHFCRSVRCFKKKARGFSEVRVNDRESWLHYREYIGDNPVKAGLADAPQQYPYSYTYLAKKRGQGLKPKSV